MDVQFACDKASGALATRALDGTECVGEPTELVVEIHALEPLTNVKAWVGEPCAVRLASGLGERTIHGVVAAITAVASDVPQGPRHYRVVMQSAMARLGLRRDFRIYQEQAGVDIAALLIDESGAGSAARELSGEHPPIRQLTQYDETHLSLVRRLCERDGFWYRFEPGDGADEVVLCDDAKGSPKVELSEPLVLTEEAGLSADVPRAWHADVGRARALGRVETAGYDFRNPALAIVGDAEAGLSCEKAVRAYRVAPFAKSASDAKRVATIALEAARAKSQLVTFSTSAFMLEAGKRFDVEPAADYAGATPESELFCTRITHRWRSGEAYHCHVEATPTAVPFRLARMTPLPKISGVQSAIVTGPPGEEIFTDEDGCVRVHFHWDRTGPTDDKSSAPVRVMHPNLGGSMLIPRIGWEVWVAFEEGDPDRPFVIGRAYNGKHGPPVALPANKTMTMLSTSSSPGSGAVNSVSFEDGAGRQGLNWNAGLGLTQTIGANANIQTVADEKIAIKGSQVLSVGGNQTESIHAARVVSTPVQTLSVAGNQELKTPSASHVKAGTEVIACATLMEKVGSPGGALGALAAQAGMTVGGMIPGVGAMLGVGKTAHDAYKAYEKGGAKGAAAEVGKGLLNMVPGGDMVGDAIDVVEAGNHAPWQDDAKTAPDDGADGAQEGSTVGGGPAAGAGGAADGGGGNRVHEVGGSTTESIGGAYAVATGGQSKWTTLGASSIAVGGPHVTTAGKASWMVGGASVHTTGAFAVNAVKIVRDVRVMSTTVAAFSLNGASGIKFKAAAINLTCGVLSVTGKLVLNCKGTKVIVDGSGLTVIGATVTFNGPVVCDKADRS